MVQWKERKKDKIYIPPKKDVSKMIAVPQKQFMGAVVEAPDKAPGVPVTAAPDGTIGNLLQPLDEIAGFKVRPGYYRMEGAFATVDGVSFSISSHGATSCTLLLFHPYERVSLLRSCPIPNPTISGIRIPCWYTD